MGVLRTSGSILLCGIVISSFMLQLKMPPLLAAFGGIVAGVSAQFLPRSEEPRASLRFVACVTAIAIASAFLLFGPGFRL